MRKKNYRVDKPITGWLFMLPQLLFFAVFTIYPVFEGFRISLFNTTYVSDTFVGLENYVELFADPIFLTSVRNTLFLVVTIVPATLLFSLFVATAVFDKSPRYISVIRSFYYLPVVVSTVVMSMVWNFLLNPANGLVSYLMREAGMPAVNLLGDRRTVLWVITFVTVVASVGQGIILYIAAMIGIPADIFEAAEVDGASKLRRVFRIVIPLSKPTTLYLFVINVISVLKLFVIIQLLTDGGPNNASMTMMYYLYRNAFIYDKSNKAAAIGVLMFLISLILVIPQFRSIFKKEK